MHSIKIIYIVFFFLLFLFSCDNPTNPASIIKDNSNDPTNPNFEEPKTSEIIIPEVNGKVIDSIFTISWIANIASTSFSYNLNNTFWTDWQIAKNITISYLDDGQYSIAVKSKHANGMEEKVPLTKIFSVDAIINNSIYFFPRKKKVNNYTEFTSEIKLDKLKEFTALKIVVLFNPNEIEYQSFDEDKSSPNNILYKNGEALSYTEYEKPGTLILNIVRIGQNPIVSGSGTIGKLKFKSKYLTDNQRIYISNSSIVQKGFDKVDVNFYTQVIEKGN